MWSKYYATHQLRETPTISTQKRVCQPECQERVEVKDLFARKQSLSRGEPITGSSSPIKTPASTADLIPVRPALLYPSTMIQLREMSATRVNKGKVKSNQIRSKHHAHSQLRKVPTMSARPRQRRECQPECQERVEAKSM